GLALALWRGERRRWVRLLGVAAVVLVAVQGVLGGLRVLLRAETIAIVHGCLAPAFFALTVVLARVTGGGWAASPPPAPGGQLRALAIAAGLVLYVQIVLGALLTHRGWVGLHLAGAAAVFVFVPIVTARARATGEPGGPPRDRDPSGRPLTPPTEAVAVAVARERRQVATDLCALAKPRVVLMVLVTTLVGFYVGSTGALDLARLLHLLLGTALAAGGTLALNQYLERDVDARMLRTRTRPLPDGRLQPPEALGFGALVLVAGLAYLAVVVGGLAALVTALTAVLYLCAYTPLKLRTPFCMIVGAVPGALPP